MKLPIIVAEGPTCILFFTSVENAESLEAIDVSAGIYRAWDAEGRPIDLLVERKREGWFFVREETVVRCDESRSKQADELRQLLLNLLGRIGISDKQDASLEEIVRIAMEHGDVDWGRPPDAAPASGIH